MPYQNILPKGIFMKKLFTVIAVFFSFSAYVPLASAQDVTLTSQVAANRQAANIQQAADREARHKTHQNTNAGMSDEERAKAREERRKARQEANGHSGRTDEERAKAREERRKARQEANGHGGGGHHHANGDHAKVKNASAKKHSRRGRTQRTSAQFVNAGGLGTIGAQ
jgi:hypothetical protein